MQKLNIRFLYKNYLKSKMIGALEENLKGILSEPHHLSQP